MVVVIYMEEIYRTEISLVYIMNVPNLEEHRDFVKNTIVN